MNRRPKGGSKANFDRALVPEAAVAKARAERWLEENRAALNSYNAWVEANGLPLEEYRRF